MHLFCFKKQQNFNIFTSNVFAHAKSDIFPLVLGGFRKTIEINKDEWHFLNAMIFGPNGKRHWKAHGSKHVTFPLVFDGFCKTNEITKDQ